MLKRARAYAAGPLLFAVEVGSFGEEFARGSYEHDLGHVEFEVRVLDLGPTHRDAMCISVSLHHSVVSRNDS